MILSFIGHVLFATGIGNSGSSTNSEIVNFNGSLSCSIPNYPTALAYAAGGIVDGVPMVCGGHNYGGGVGPQSDCYSLQSNTWTHSASMTSGRSGLSAVPLNGGLWVIIFFKSYKIFGFLRKMTTL